MSGLKTRHNIADWPPRTLILLDEIQESPEAIWWMRFLYEDHPEIVVVAAGPTIQVKIAVSLIFC